MSDLLIEPWKHRPQRRPDTAHAVTNADALSNGADRLTAARILLSTANNIREGKVPPLIEIKGLGAAVAAAKTSIANVRTETSGLSTDATALVSAIQDVRTQIKQAHADIQFEAETLGNGGEKTSGEQGV